MCIMDQVSEKQEQVAWTLYPKEDSQTMITVKKPK